MDIDALYLTPPVVTSNTPQFQNTFSAIATLFPICYLSQLKRLNAIVLEKPRASWKAREAHLIPKAKTIEPLGMNKRDQPQALCYLYLFFGLFFLAATPYRVIPCNFRLLFYSSIYSVYSWFFLINLMKTFIGRSKYCIPQPFSRFLFTNELLVNEKMRKKTYKVVKQNLQKL